MRAEIKRLHIAQNATTVYVTHDQIEAMAMGDRIVVMSAAVVQQVGTPFEVYYNPSNLFVARFIGSPGMNLVEGRLENGIVHLPGDNKFEVPSQWLRPLAEQLSTDQIVLGFRPEAASANIKGHLRAEVYSSDLHGAFNMVNLTLGNVAGENVIHIRAERGIGHAIGEMVSFDLDPELVRFFNPKTEMAILPEAAV